MYNKILIKEPGTFTTRKKIIAFICGLKMAGLREFVTFVTRLVLFAVILLFV